MPRTLADIFTDYPGVDVLEVVSSNDGGPLGLSADGRRLKILDDNFARQLAGLPNANTESGHITDEGYCVHGGFSVREYSYKASVRRVSR
jgi:hypothetical protein